MGVKLQMLGLMDVTGCEVNYTWLCMGSSETAMLARTSLFMYNWHQSHGYNMSRFGWHSNYMYLDVFPT